MPYSKGKVKPYKNTTTKKGTVAPKTSLRPKARPYKDVTPRAEKGDATLMRMQSKSKKK